MGKILLVLVLIGLGVYYLPSQGITLPNLPTQGPYETSVIESSGIEVVVKNLDVPWEISFLPDPPGGEASKTFFVTERKGIVWQFDGNNKKQLLKLDDFAAVGEGGLLGMAQHPQHEKNGYTYLYYTYEQNGLKNKVVRYSHVGDSLKFDRVIIYNIPGNANHNGGRIKFGPDNKLYITTGDSQDPSTAQDINSLAGKILRLNDDGSIPSDNPISGNPMFSYGHRNPQGLAWDSSGRLWATEHGQSAQDEVNVIYPGKNYGWPDIRGNQEKTGMEKPFLHSGSSTWAPSGMLIKGNTLYFAGLRGAAIFALNVKDRVVKEFFKNQYGRIRTIVEGPDSNFYSEAKAFYILTNNRDGRGNPTADDDRLLKIPKKALVADSKETKTKVARVLDGDTIELEDRKRVRYTGVDAPESGDCFGYEASRANLDLVFGKEVSLETDAQVLDQFQRTLAYVWLGEKMINEELVRLGYARVATYPPNVKYQTRFMAAEKEARDKDLGLWSPDACVKRELQTKS